MRYTEDMSVVRRITALLSILTVLTMSQFAFAQSTPKLLITWQAHTLVSPLYKGKALPSAGSSIDVKLLALQGDTILNLAAQDITWLLNGTKIASGKGLTSLVVPLNYFGTSHYTLTALLPDYEGVNLSQAIAIDTTTPQLIITGTPSARQSTLASLSAFGYFFNALRQSDLDITWSAGGVSQSGRSITLDYGTRSSLSVQAQARNLLQQYEQARANYTIYHP